VIWQQKCSAQETAAVNRFIWEAVKEKQSEAKGGKVMSMFCYQCEQTADGKGCTIKGICGKDEETSSLQDAIVYVVKGISQYAQRARVLGASDKEVNQVTLEALFMTLTNVNFDSEEHYEYLQRLGTVLKKAEKMYETACAAAKTTPVKLQGPAAWHPSADKREIARFAATLSILKRIETGNEDIVGLQELVTYGIKGLAAYAHHAHVLGYYDESISEYVHRAMDYLTKPDQTVNDLLGLALEAGKVNLTVMELLNRAHIETFGKPVPTSVRTTPLKGKCILVSGHDLKYLHELLKQTEGKGIKVYTHGEMLPAHGYPGLKKFAHLAGNYGTAWQNQVKEFEQFPGAVVLTTNCLKPPADSYKDRLFTMDVVGFKGIRKLKSMDFSPAIEAALAADGFAVDEPEHSILVGFGHDAVLGVADKVIAAVKAGKIKHFFLVGGCDGAEFARNYYVELAEKIPSDCVILTLGCAKYRFNMKDFKDIEGIPRLLDIGQCNDSYSAIKIAAALAEAFQCGINDLPLSLVLSWFEQKAVAVLLTLLYLGVKNIRIGPNLPAFVTPAVLKQLVEGYGLTPVGKVEDDLDAMLGLVRKA
jgi:hydroxylamine reductase